MEKEIRLEDDQSPQYFNGEGLDRFSDTLAGDALGEFFQDKTEEGGQEMTSMMHNLPDEATESVEDP